MKTEPDGQKDPAGGVRFKSTINNQMQCSKAGRSGGSGSDLICSLIGITLQMDL